MFRAVTFDLWGTLILSTEGYDQTLQKKREELLYNAVREKVSREEVAKALEESWNHIESLRSTLRDVPTDRQVQIVQSLLKVDISIEKPYTEAMLHHLPEVNPYAEEVLSQLEVKIGLISNTGRTPGKVIRVVLETMGILSFFDCTLFSNEVGYLKPHPEIFNRAAQALGVRPAHVLHAGDNPKTDGEGARQAGMQFLLIRESVDLRKVLELVT